MNVNLQTQHRKIPGGFGTQDFVATGHWCLTTTTQSISFNMSQKCSHSLVFTKDDTRQISCSVIKFAHFVHTQEDQGFSKRPSKVYSAPGGLTNSANYS